MPGWEVASVSLLLLDLAHALDGVGQHFGVLVPELLELRGVEVGDGGRKAVEAARRYQLRGPCQVESALVGGSAAGRWTTRSAS